MENDNKNNDGDIYDDNNKYHYYLDRDIDNIKNYHHYDQ